MFRLLIKRTFWLTLTNFALGLAVLLTLLVLFSSMVRDLLRRLKGNRSSEYQREDDLHEQDELGIRMADGGERVDPKGPRKE